MAVSRRMIGFWLSISRWQVFLSSQAFEKRGPGRGRESSTDLREKTGAAGSMVDELRWYVAAER